MFFLFRVRFERQSFLWCASTQPSRQKVEPQAIESDGWLPLLGGGGGGGGCVLSKFFKELFVLIARYPLPFVADRKLRHKSGPRALPTFIRIVPC